MGHLNNKRLLIGLAIFFLICWGPGLLITPHWLGILTSMFILIFGILSLVQRIHPTYEVLWVGRRDDEERYAHLGIVGDSLIAAGVVYAGIYAAWFFLAGQPDGWGGTMTASFWRILIGTGLLFNYMMAQGSRPGGTAITGSKWLWLAILLAFVAGMIVMGQLREKPVDILPAIFPIDRPTCPPDRLIAGTGRKTFHTEQSPYRALIVPRRCFSTKREAIIAGYKEVR